MAQKTNVYEAMFIFDSNRFARERAALPAEVEAAIKSAGGDGAVHLADVTEGWAASLVLLADRVQEARTAHSLENLRGSDTLYQYINLEQFSPLRAHV